jgi:hypothetical protein
MRLFKAGEKIRKEFLMPSLIFLFVSIFFLLPIFKNFSFWGQMDWDQSTFWSAVSRVSILKYHQFPLWNPYASGGTAMLAHPHSSFLSPMFLNVLFFGPILGLKLQIFLHLFLGMLGMFLLSRYLGYKGMGCYLTPFIYMLSSIYPLHITEGHAEWMAMAWLPWLFLFYLKALKKNRFILLAVVFFSLMIFGGAPNIVYITILLLAIFSILNSIQLRKIRPLKMVIFLFLGTSLLCSIKLVPMLEFLYSFPRYVQIEGQGLNLKEIYYMLFSRNQAQLYNQWRFLQDLNDTGFGAYWHECGAYIGFIPFLLSMFGLLFWKKIWPLVVTCILLFVICLGYESSINLWKYLHMLPIYNYSRFPSRYILAIIFSLSILSGFGIEKLGIQVRDIKNRYIRFIPILLTIFVLIDLTCVNSRIFKMAFTIPPLEIHPDSHFHQRADYWGFNDRITRSAMYPVFLANNGVINAYQVISVPTAESISIKPWETEEMNDWVMMGPFLEEAIVERQLLNKIDKREVYKHKNKCYGWREFRPVIGCCKSYLFFDLGSFNNKEMKFFLGTYIYSPRQRKAQLRFGRNGCISFWINGINVFNDNAYKQTKRSQEVIRYHLKSGWNYLLIRLKGGEIFQKYKLRLILGRITDFSDNPFTDLVFCTKKEDKRAINFYNKKPLKDNYKGEVYFLNHSGEARILHFSPNVITVEAHNSEDGVLVLNQNYYKGWRVKGSTQNIEPWMGLVSLKVNKGEHILGFYYLPRSFVIGLLISLITGLSFLIAPRFVSKK